MENIEPDRASGDGGNIVPSPTSDKKQKNQCKNWIFTKAVVGGLETIEPEGLALRKKLLNIAKNFIFQAEKGKDTGYLHFQGRFTLLEKRRLTELKRIFDATAYLAPEKNKTGSVEYCQKSETSLGHVWTEKAQLRNTLTLEQLYPYQREIVEKCEIYADDRTVNWYWEPEGRVGKSALCRYLLDNRGECLYIDGGCKNDISYYITQSNIRNWDNPVILFNIPRSKTTISYSAIEALKDGILFSPKYESSTNRFNTPHIFVFANFEPEEKEIRNLSADRWNIIKIEKS